jgi:hypothetical protein
VDVCHYSEDEDKFVLINIPQRTAARTHLNKHQDVLAPEEDEVAELMDPSPEEGEDAYLICLNATCAEVECPSEAPSMGPSAGPSEFPTGAPSAGPTSTPTS